MELLQMNVLVRLDFAPLKKKRLKAWMMQ